MKLSSLELKKLSYFKRELAKPEKQTKISALKKFLIFLQKNFLMLY